MTALDVQERLVKRTTPTIKKAIDAIHKPSLTLAKERHRQLMAQFRRDHPKDRISEEDLSVSTWNRVRQDATKYAEHLYADAQTELAGWWRDVQTFRDERRAPASKSPDRPQDVSPADKAILRELADLRNDMHAARVRDDVKGLSVPELLDVLRDLDAAEDGTGARVVERLIEKALETSTKPATQMTAVEIMQDKPKRDAWRLELETIRDRRLDAIAKTHLENWDASRSQMDADLRRGAMLLQTSRMNGVGGLRNFVDTPAA